MEDVVATKRVGEHPNADGAGTRTTQCESLDWYAEGESRTVVVDGVQVTVRYVGRKGRRSRIAVVAPAGAAFVGGDVKMLK
jgi:hypothetical protein